MAEYEFIQTSINENKIKEYAQLLSSVFEKSKKFSFDFLHWQYALNPNGPVVGFDAYANETLAAHYVTIPVVYTINGSIVKGLLSLNTATHPQHQGKGLFTQLASKTYELGEKLGYKFVIGIANQNSTHGFLKKLGFYLVSPLDVKIGIGHITANTNCNYKIKPIWTNESIDWRLKCPSSTYFYNKMSIYSKTDNPIIFSKLIELPKNSTIKHLERKSILPLKLWIGLFKDIRTKGLFLNLPDRFKPSPLNLIFKNLSYELAQFKKEDICFELIDFDAY